MKRGIIISVSGPSGVGKGTVIEKLREINPEFGFSVSATTRAPREGEVEGESYFFKSKEEFEAMVEAGDIIEYDEYVGNYYGTPAVPLAMMSDEGVDVLLDLTIPGSLILKEMFGDQAVTIFLNPPSFEELEKRLTGRGTEAEEVVQKRLAEAENEIAEADKFDHIVINDDLDQAVKEIMDIINKAKEE